MCEQKLACLPLANAGCIENKSLVTINKNNFDAILFKSNFNVVIFRILHNIF